MKKEEFGIYSKEYLRLKQHEVEMSNQIKKEELNRGVKFALIWLIMSGVFAILVLAISVSLKLVG